MGLRSLEDGYVPPILDVAQLDRKLLVSNAEAAAAVRVLLDREGLFAGVSAGAVVHVARRVAEELPEGAVVVAVLADGGWKYLSAPFWTRRGDRRGGALVVVPAAIRAELRAHAAEEAPNECCGLLVFRDGVASSATSAASTSSPRRTATSWRSTRSSGSSRTTGSSWRLPLASRRPSRVPSRTDRELAGLWSGRPFLIYGLKLDELRAWRVAATTSRCPSTTRSQPGRLDASGVTSIGVERSYVTVNDALHDRTRAGRRRTCRCPSSGSPSTSWCPSPPTDVFLFTPGPVRWKLWIVRLVRRS